MTNKEMLTNSRDVDLQKVVDFDQESGCHKQNSAADTLKLGTT